MARLALPAFALFLFVGLVLAWQLRALELLEARASGGWVETPCVVLESRVDEPGDGTRVVVHYEYRFEGRVHRSDRYEFASFHTDGYADHVRVVDSLPAGTETVCWVDPDDPTRSVMVRELGTRGLFLLLPLGLAAVGIVGLLAAWVALRRGPHARIR